MKRLQWLLLLSISLACTQVDRDPPVQEYNTKTSFDQNVKDILEAFRNDSNSYVMVAAHRGDWRNAPENSIWAIENCIKMGVDIVEIDVRMTKDGRLVVIHDAAIDRTMTGSGLVSHFTLDSLKSMFLRNGQGIPTHHKIPTLKEAMMVAKGKILVNLDKCWDYIPEAYGVLQATGTTEQAIFKGKDTYDQVRDRFGTLMDSIIYMPIFSRETENIDELLKGFIAGSDPDAYEVLLRIEDSPMLPYIQTINDRQQRVWVNTLWADLCAGHHDDRAVEDPDANWGWVIAQGADILQTDRPEMMLEYLISKSYTLN